MGCQKKIAQKITEKHANYLFSLKGNHETAVDITKAFFACHELGEKVCKKTGEESCEPRYFITSVDDVTKAAVALRSHWGIENNLHWVLDVVFDEDFSTVRKDNSA